MSQEPCTRTFRIIVSCILSGQNEKQAFAPLIFSSLFLSFLLGNENEKTRKKNTKESMETCRVLGSRKNGRLLFSGTGSTGGSGIPVPVPAAAAPSSPAALSAVEILTLVAAGGASEALAIVTGAGLPLTSVGAGLRFYVAEMGKEVAMEMQMEMVMVMVIEVVKNSSQVEPDRIDKKAVKLNRCTTVVYCSELRLARLGYQLHLTTPRWGVVCTAVAFLLSFLFLVPVLCCGAVVLSPPRNYRPCHTGTGRVFSAFQADSSRFDSGFKVLGCCQENRRTSAPSGISRRERGNPCHL